MSIRLNGALIKEELKNIKKEKKELETIYEEINNEIVVLKDHWDSETSDEVYTNYDDFKEYFQGIINSLEDDIKFLNNAVNDYEIAEYNASRAIEDKLAG